MSSSRKLFITKFYFQVLLLQITKECRNQLIEPTLNIAKRDNSTDKISMISVYGGVHFPGTYPYSNGMSLADAIKSAGGTLGGIYDSEIELSRRNNVGNKFTTSNSFSSLERAEQLEVAKMDIITVKQLSNKVRTVEITGEVYFPGTYPIKENETLSELIKRAGGITQYADVQAAVFQRDEIMSAELKRMREAQADLQRKIVLSSQAAGVGQDSLSAEQINQLQSLLSTDNVDRESLGRLVIDLDEILAGANNDIELRDKDKINIPKNKQSISVIGEVYVSNTHLYDERLNVADYVRLSGGMTDFADESNIYIIKSDGSIISPSQITSGFFRSSSSQLTSGDTIVVPLEIGSFNQIRAATEITQIIYQMALAAAAVNSF